MVYLSELRNGKKIDIYRRNLQRAYIERWSYLMTTENQRFLQHLDVSLGGTSVNVSQSDIRAVVRAELKSLQSAVRSGANRTSDRMSKIHLQDALERIDAILNPNG